MSIIRSDYHVNLSRQQRDEILFGRSNIYYFIGKLDNWPDEFTPPPEPSNTFANDVIIRDNMLYLRKVTANDVSLVCKNNQWTSGTVYDHWDHTIDMINRPFYVVTDEFNVYKCLNNNNGAASTVKPTSTALSTISTADGYLWKYMYNVPIVKRRKFTSNAYLPVQKALTDSFYSKGAIEEVIVLNGGSGYSSSPQTTVLVEAAPLGGTTAEIAAYVNATTGEIDSVEIINAGDGYLTAPTLTVVGTGTGKYPGNTDALLTAYIFDNKVDRVVINDPGVGYSADTDTTIASQGDGTGAVFYPKIEDGIITGIIVANPGINYTFIDLNVVSTTGDGADLSAVIGASDFLSDQSQVEQSAIKGSIHAINVTEGGTGYSGTTQVTITGDGTGATAHATVVNGAITRIDMDTFGSGYTTVNVSITDVNRLEPNNFVNASAYAILPPIDGHGFNAERELFGDTLSIFVLVRSDAELSALEQDYRQFGLLRNPVNVLTRQLINAEIYFTPFTCTLGSVENIEIDEILICNNKRYRVVDIDESQVVVQQLSSIYGVPSGVFSKEDNSSTYSIISVDTVPVVDKYSGDLLYVSNNTPFVPTTTQAFGIRTYITL